MSHHSASKETGAITYELDAMLRSTDIVLLALLLLELKTD